VLRENNTGTPQGSILSPLLSNVALSVLDEYIAQAPGARRAANGSGGFAAVRGSRISALSATRRLVPDGERHQGGRGTLREEIAGVLAGMGLRLSPEKTLVTHIDEGLNFLGWRIQRHWKKGEDRQYVCTYPAKKALRAICQKVKDVCRGTNIDQPLPVLLHRLNRCCAAGVSTSAWCVQ